MNPFIYPVDNVKLSLVGNLERENKAKWLCASAEGALATGEHWGTTEPLIYGFLSCGEPFKKLHYRANGYNL